MLDDGAREREVALPRGEWIETWSGARVRGGGEVVGPAPLERIPVWVRARLDRRHLPGRARRRGLGDVPEGERPLIATLWGEPRSAAPRSGWPTGPGSRGAAGSGR